MHPQAPEDHVIFETGFFRAGQSLSCPIPGYLILEPREAVHSLAEMKPEVLSGLGDALALAAQVIETVVKPERVYFARFGEEAEEVHFHVFPRTRWLAERYRRETGRPDSSISGPLILDWARKAFRPGQVHPMPGPGLPEAVLAMKACAKGLIRDRGFS